MSTPRAPPPPGTNYLAVIRPTLNSVLIAQSFTVVVVLLFGAIFFFSTKASRRKPIFVLNVVTLLLAFVVGVLLDYRGITTIVNPSHSLPRSLNTVIGVLGAVQYILVDTTLLVRLTSVYPRSYIGTRKFLLIIALPVLLKLLRVINLIIFISVLVDALRRPDANAVIAKIWAGKPYLKIEWVCQAVDNTYVSILFLWTLYHRRRLHNDSGTTSTGRASLTQRLRVIFWFAVYSFFFPLLFSIVQLIVVFWHHGTGSGSGSGGVSTATINHIVLVNTSVAVIGVVFATVWAESENWLDDTRHRRSRRASDGTALTGGSPNEKLTFKVPRRPVVYGEGRRTSVVPREAFRASESTPESMDGESGLEFGCGGERGGVGTTSETSSEGNPTFLILESVDSESQLPGRKVFT